MNAKLHSDINDLKESEDGMNAILDSGSTHKLLYSLKIIEGLNLKAAEEEK